MSLKIYYFSLFSAIFATIILRYRHDGQPIPIIGSSLEGEWIVPPHCILFSVALALNLLSLKYDS